MERIYTATGNNVFSHYTMDVEKGVPYCAVHVGEKGDYWCTVYGALCFSRSTHERIIRDKKPIGKDITAQKYFENKKK